MEILRDKDLTSFNTFGVKARAKYFIEINTEAELLELFKRPEFTSFSRLFLGGGSNILFTRDFDGIVVLNKLKGIEIVEDLESALLVRAASGEIWHDLVLFAVERGLWGIENLSFIPGTVGGAPMQNIGAYGSELQDSLVAVEAFDIVNGDRKIWSANECELGYRDSIFKNRAKGKYFITAITLRLSKIPTPNTEYRALKEYLEKNNITDRSLKTVSNAVTAIRQSKLPDPKILGNVGSFFKNVFVDEEVFRELRQIYPDIPNFREGDEIKIPAGWLIEACGWKGKKVGNVGMHDKQALVLVNYGGATGTEIKSFADMVIASVRDKFGLTLVPEVNFV